METFQPTPDAIPGDCAQNATTSGVAGSTPFRLMQGDCLTLLKTLADNSVDAIVTDPPYELGFMGKSWDSSGIAFNVDVWKEALRALKPGGHLLAFSGSRTYHRMAVAIEDAGFHIRDQIMWVYGSGFPKSMDVSKAIDKAAGAVREVVGVAGKSGTTACFRGMTGNAVKGEYLATAPATPAAQQWEGWGTALKPAHEPLVLARKPLEQKTVAANVIEHGTGALNIDGCRVESSSDDKAMMNAKASKNPSGKAAANVPFVPGICSSANDAGRWPANFIHDGSIEEDWARFFYCAKASKKDRDAGLEALPDQVGVNGNKWTDQDYRDPERVVSRKNIHPTVKPTDLMRYLCRLITPPGGLVLDPFMGSGSTGKAAVLEGFGFVGMDLSAEYIAIADARIKHALTIKEE